jgi:glycosyltransferase involved in cell wall biosynthesis
VRPRVLVDARFISAAPSSSHARYLRELTRVWSADAALDLDIILYAAGPLPSGLPQSARVQWRVAGAPLSRLGRRAAGGRVWLNSAFTLAALQLRPDALFFPYPFVPRLLPAPAVVTLHDVCFRLHPEFFADGGRSLDLRAQRAVRSATAVIAVSHSSKLELRAAYNADPARVHVIHHGITPSFDAVASPADTSARVAMGIGEAYFLCVSTHEPRKNLEVIAEAYVRLNEANPTANVDLVLVGQPNEYTRGIISILNRSSRAQARTRLLNGVSDAQLAALYRGALAVLVPTRCEGFGFPVLEALACGARVFATDLCVFRELAGTAVTYLPAEDPDAWTAAMLNAAARPAAVIDDGSDAAAAMVRRFSWAASADATKAVLRAVALKVQVPQGD